MNTPGAVRLREAALAFAKGAAVEPNADDPEDRAGQRRDRALRAAAVDYARDPLAVGPEPAATSVMPTRKPSPIQAVPVAAGFYDLRIIRPGARYAVHRDGDARPGAWLPDGEPLAAGWTDDYPEDEARALLPFLRALGHGRKAGEPTTPDGRLVARAMKRLGVSAAALGERIGAHESVLSRARNGKLPEKHRTAIRALLKPGAGKAT